MLATLSGRVGHEVAHGDPAALHLIYSITKSFIGVTFVRLAEEGRLSLDDPLRRWLEDDRLPAATLRHLLTHTSGIPDYGRLRAYHDAIRATPSEPWSDDELIERALALGPDFAPGDGWAYSNTGYLLLRRVLDRFGGILPTVETFGLTSTSLAARPEDLRALVPGASETLGGDVRGRYDPRWVGHRSLISNCVDLHRFAARLLTTRLADPSTFVPIGYEAPAFVRPSYGLGVMADPEHPLGVLIGHGGGGPGYAAAAFAVSTHGEPVAAVALSDSEPTPQIERIALELLREAARAPRR